MYVWECQECVAENETAIFKDGTVMDRCRVCGTTHKIVTKCNVVIMKYGR